MTPDALQEVPTSTETSDHKSLFADLDLGQAGQNQASAEAIEDLEAQSSEETASPVLSLVNRILA